MLGDVAVTRGRAAAVERAQHALEPQTAMRRKPNDGTGAGLQTRVKSRGGGQADGEILVQRQDGRHGCGGIGARREEELWA